MTLVPGVTITTAGGPNVDAGGTAGYTYAAAQIHGSSQYDQTIGTYGIPMTLIDNIGKSRINLPDGTVQEYDMRYSSLPAELAYGGFTVNAIPKVGGNLFSGSIFLTGTGSALQASNLDDELRAQGLTAEAKVKDDGRFQPGRGRPDRQGQDLVLRRIPLPVHRQLHRRHVVRQEPVGLDLRGRSRAGRPTRIN